MIPDYVTNLNIEQFRRIVMQKKLIIIYPVISYRNVFLSYFLQSNSNHLFYYRLPYDGILLTDWLEELRRYLPVTDTPFHETDLNTITGPDAPRVLGRMLGEYLQSLPRAATVLYWDEIDRTPQDNQFRAFMEALVPLIPSYVQVAINARRLDYLPWIDFINSDVCAVLGTNYRQNNLIYTDDRPPKPQLEVYAFGQGLALINGHEMVNWDGALPRQMFYYFLDHPLVTRDEIFKVFWPQLPVKEATNVFHVTKRKIGEQITRLVADGKDYELTYYNAGFYKPSPAIERHYDVAEFEQAIEQGYTTDDEQTMLEAYERAIHLYQGDYLTTLDLPWVVQRRDQLRSKFVDALIGVGRVHKEHERPHNAISYYIRALREVPLREDVHRDLMSLYMQLGRREDALRQYAALVDLLDHRLHVPPSPETQDLYEQIMAAPVL
ncbi:MAG: bacterial transcriptional activator domain-containing protein [Anaerolineae bacterium]